MTFIEWKPVIRVISVELQLEMFHQWFLSVIVSEICHIGPYCNSRHVLAWIMTWHILFITGLLYSLLHPCLYYSKYCSFSRKSSFLLISASFPHHLSLGWGILSEHHPALPQPKQPHPPGMGCSRTPVPPGSTRSWSDCCKMPFFALPCVLPANIALIPHTIIPAQWKGKLPLTKSDLTKNLQFF